MDLALINEMHAYYTAVYSFQVESSLFLSYNHYFASHNRITFFLSDSSIIPLEFLHQATNFYLCPFLQSAAEETWQPRPVS